MYRFLAAISFVLGAFLTLTSAADWPQWRGPNRDGVSTESVEPWQGELKVLWKQELGEGHSSPVVANGRAFVHSKIKGKEQEEVLAVDVKTGKAIWEKTYDRDPYKNEYGNGPRATPLVDGDRLYTLGVTGILACWDTASGKEHWKVDLLKEFKAKNLFFGVSTTPIIDGDKLLVMVGGAEASIVSLDKLTGKPLWKTGSDRASYASPIITEFAGKKMAVFLTQQGVLALNPADGQPYWKAPLVDQLNESSTTPVRVGDMLFASSVTFGSLGLKLTTKDDKPAYEQLWKNDRLTCYFSTPVAVGEHLYVVSGNLLPPSAALKCVEAKTGKVVWTHPKVGKYHATVMLAKDKLLMLEEEGDLVLIDPNPKEYKELARAKKVCGTTWAHPALSDGKLFVRDGKELICLQLGRGQ